jgi:leucyl aminopeptidase (aminopeptidase T)
MEGSAEGRLVVDGTIASYGLPDAPADLRVEAGHLVEAKGVAGEWLMKTLNAAGEEGTNVAELGIGTNEKAELTGEILEDEKILGTAHVAFGANASMGGRIQVPVHLDVVMLEPDVTVDGEPVVRAGELVV